MLMLLFLLSSCASFGGRGREADGGADAGGRLAIVRDRRGSVFDRRARPTDPEPWDAAFVDVDDADGDDERLRGRGTSEG